ncbi:MAG: VIT1/CCC1 transporter family protein [Candidatus Omnitrophica bacterium]|nr:VIT1/CCC1 transporter family protein [Candidatus Omnitrophota bacterium]
MLNSESRKKILIAQKNELTEYHVYQKLSEIVKKEGQSGILQRISNEEFKHYEIFKKISGEDVQPDQWKIFYYVLMARICGLNFSLRLMERGELSAQDFYSPLKDETPEVKMIIGDEKAHESALLDLIDEDRFKYVSSMILGLNDALVELTATLAGFTLALNNTKLIGIVGLITGIAAAMSMAASEYLSTKGEETDKDPIKACWYTGVSYLGTVIVLVLPYFLLKNVFVCLAIALSVALLEIGSFTFYISVAQKLNFKKRFTEMAVLSLSIAAITFVIGVVIRNVFNVNI